MENYILNLYHSNRSICISFIVKNIHNYMSNDSNFEQLSEIIIK